MSRVLNFGFTSGSEIREGDEEETMLKRTSKSNRCLCYWSILATVVMIALIITVAVLANKPVSKSEAKPNLKAADDPKRVRWCTVTDVEQQKCLNMSSAFANAMLDPKVQCIKKDDVGACIEALSSNVADVFTTDGGYIYQNMQQLKPIMAEDYGFGDASYWAVAIVKKLDQSINLTAAGLKGKSSCHTGYQKSAGWNMPMGMLKSLGIVSGCNDDLIQSATSVFSKICAPGGDCRICSNCNDQCTDSCDDKDFSHYTGAFRCLNAKGDIAFAKHTTAFENTDGNNPADWAKDLSSDDFELLCPDGKRAPLGNFASCNLGKVPSHAVVVSANAEESTIQSIVQLLIVAQYKFGPGSDFELFGKFSNKPDMMFKSSTKRLIPLDKSCTAQHFLGSDYISNMDQVYCNKNRTEISFGSKCFLSQYSTRFPTSLRWCVISDGELQKCKDVSSMAQMAGASLPIECLQAKDWRGCASMVGSGGADLLNLDSGEIYHAGLLYNLQPIAAEYYGSASDEDSASSYYVVAVIKADDTTTNLTKAGLKGKKTCHTGYQKTSGWNVPLGYLASQKIINVDSGTCDFPKQVANLFGGSCVPGINKRIYPKLCSQCSGVGEEKCTSKSEPYRGYQGALQCLADGKGDIAFVNHLIIPPANYSQYKLLCKDGTTASPSDYKTCSFQQVPSHALLASSENSPIYNEIIWTVLDLLQKAPNSQLFNSTAYDGKANLMFKDATQCLWKAKRGCDWQNYLGRDYVTFTDSVYCRNEAVSTFTEPCEFIKCGQN